MTGLQIAMTALTIGLYGVFWPRGAFCLAFIGGVTYLTLGWIPFGP